uniref:Uncharacterized protein n=1 Tax=Rhizophora mucronata TaxID=61149 RepID=A0A2P2N4X6_RHIMU
MKVCMLSRTSRHCYNTCPQIVNCYFGPKYSKQEKC